MRRGESQLPGRPAAILIDLDGTLIDTVPDLARSVDDLMEAFNRPPHGEEQVRRWVGNGVTRLIHRALTGEMETDATPEAFAAAEPVFLSRYDRNNGQHSRIYPGVEVALEAFHAAGFTLGCITNKAERFTGPLLERLGLASAFSLVLSGDSLPRQKPDPLPIQHAAAHFGCAAAEVLMLGDSRSDVRAARAAGCPIVCVSYGYNHGRDIRDDEPDVVVDSLADVPALIPPV